jgi:hypothetical protein
MPGKSLSEVVRQSGHIDRHLSFGSTLLDQAGLDSNLPRSLSRVLSSSGKVVDLIDTIKIYERRNVPEYMKWLGMRPDYVTVSVPRDNLLYPTRNWPRTSRG